MNGSALASTRPYTHSNFSVLTANKLVVGRFEYEAPKEKCMVVDRTQKYPDTTTFVFSYGKSSGH